MINKYYEEPEQEKHYGDVIITFKGKDVISAHYAEKFINRIEDYKKLSKLEDDKYAVYFQSTRDNPDNAPRIAEEINNNYNSYKQWSVSATSPERIDGSKVNGWLLIKTKYGVSEELLEQRLNAHGKLIVLHKINKHYYAALIDDLRNNADWFDGHGKNIENELTKGLKTSRTAHAEIRKLTEDDVDLIGDV